jgi:hypothetical protein
LRAKRALQTGVFVLMCGAVATTAQLRFSAPDPVVLHNGNGSAAVRVFNLGTTAAPLALRAGNFVDDASQTTLPGATTTFTAVTGTALPVVIAPGGQVQLEANVSHLAGAAVASAPVFSGTNPVGRLQAVEADAPMDLLVSGPGGPGARLTLIDGANAQITVKNNDATAYPLDWSFQMDGRVLQSGELQIAPQGTARVDLLPTSDLYSWVDYVHPAEKTGQLLLALHGPPEVPREVLPQRTLQVNVRMQRLNTGWTSIWWHVFVLLVLLLGGLMSLIGNAVLPNIMRKSHLRRQVVELEERMRSLNPRVDPYLRTLLRMERKWLMLLLDRCWLIAPSAAETLDSVSVSITRLGKRLKVTERLDEMRRKLDEVIPNAPPSITDDIYTKLQQAALHLHTFGLTDEEVHAAGKVLDGEEKTFATLSDTDALARLLATNFRDLKVRQKFLPHSYYSDLKAALPGLFELLNQPFDDFRNIPRQMMFAVDFGISAIQMAFDYAILRAGTASTSGGGQGARERLEARQKELIELLGTLSWPALHDLRALVQEMRENIYEQDVLEQISTPGQAKIVYDPRTVRAFAPILFSIRFKDPRFNDAAALKGLSFKWEFPNEMLDQDWKICHFFQGNEFQRGEGRDITVAMRVESHKSLGELAKSEGTEGARALRNSLTATIEILRRERPTYSGAFAEALRFFIAFGVALAALLSGVLNQIAKLDFVPGVVAILLLGFGVDSIKNLLVQTSRRATG